MLRYVLKRLALALVTLVLLSVVVFATAQLLPGDVGRKVLGPFATQEAVDALNREIGADRPVAVQYLDWVGGILHGDFGDSLALRVPAGPLLWDAFVNSVKLAALAFLIVVPLAILGGVVAGLFAGRLPDRAITLTGISLTVVPEFVTGIVLIIVVGLWLGWLPITAEAPEGAGVLVQLEHLVLPALVLALVLFGYIARITRAGVVEALEADYTRTAYLKGLGTWTVIRRHVLRNALLPTIAVVATQLGYLFGGLVVIETLFNYQGMGRLVFNAADQKDYPLLASGVLLIGAVYLAATLAADLLYAALNPRIRYRAGE
ncbi:MAG TPA: ABC transporter permease [Gaiellaceae bacterium]|nr:ABC transporter permease [Gaiellaceae bacterium]